MSDPILTLHRYFIWANRMRDHFDEILKKTKGASALDQRDGIETFLYMSYWYGGLYTVIEGWRELDLHDKEVDGLLGSPNVELLHRYRNGALHFQQDYFDNRFMNFIGEGTSAEWVRTLNQAFGRWFLQNLKARP